MKHPSAPAWRTTPASRDMVNDFLKGCVATGILGAIQNGSGRPRLDRRKLRLALQGGTALASGGCAARALQAGQTAQALLAVALGTGAVLTLEHLMRDTPREEQQDGQEKA